jgi:hypothetical protein
MVVRLILRGSYGTPEALVSFWPGLTGQQRPLLDAKVRVDGRLVTDVIWLPRFGPDVMSL